MLCGVGLVTYGNASGAASVAKRLECVAARFAEDIGLLPQDLFTRLLDECRRGASSYDLIRRQLTTDGDARPKQSLLHHGAACFLMLA